jgi:hypothetical protein
MNQFNPKIRTSSSSTSVASNATTSKTLNFEIRQVPNWSIDTTLKWIKSLGFEMCCPFFQEHRINGRAILMLNENDLKEIVKHNVGHRKNLLHLILNLQNKYNKVMAKKASNSFFSDTTDDDEDEERNISLSLENSDHQNNRELDDIESDEPLNNASSNNNKNVSLRKNSNSNESPLNHKLKPSMSNTSLNNNKQKVSKNSQEKKEFADAAAAANENNNIHHDDNLTNPTNGFCLSCLKKIENSPYTYYEQTPYGLAPLRSYKGEKRRTLVAVIYLFFTCLWTSFSLTIVHDRVPDMEKYPPLPDLILDNVPLMPWAFFATEIIGLILLIILFTILFLHKYRLIIFRRMCSLGGTIFILRSITMLITSLSVPGVHIQCSSQVGIFISSTK